MMFGIKIPKLGMSVPILGMIPVRFVHNWLYPIDIE